LVDIRQFWLANSWFWNCVCVKERDRAIVLVAVFWHFRQPKVSVVSVTNTITSIGSHLGVSRFGTFLQWSCVSSVGISQWAGYSCWQYTQYWNYNSWCWFVDQLCWHPIEYSGHILPFFLQGYFTSGFKQLFRY
jgi:hypothetical protein